MPSSSSWQPSDSEKAPSSFSWQTCDSVCDNFHSLLSLLSHFNMLQYTLKLWLQSVLVVIFNCLEGKPNDKVSLRKKMETRSSALSANTVRYLISTIKYPPSWKFHLPQHVRIFPNQNIKSSSLPPYFLLSGIFRFARTFF